MITSPAFNSAKFRPTLTGLAALTLALLSACATNPEARVRSGLVDAGLPPPLAGCMAHRMVDRLSITQLRRLKSLTSVGKADYRDITLDEFVYKVRALDDPEIIMVTSKAALVCALDG